MRRLLVLIQVHRHFFREEEKISNSKFQSPALCELVTAKSRELESENPAEVAEWVELARRMAELSGESLGATPSSSQESAFREQS